ncbi:hypothetical protein ACMFMG_006431 [Clarireedia jacksonii]
MAETFTPKSARPNPALDAVSHNFIGNEKTPATVDDMSIDLEFGDGEDTETDEMPILNPEKRLFDGRMVNDERQTAVIEMDGRLVHCPQQYPLLTAYDGDSKIVVRNILPNKTIEHESFVVDVMRTITHEIYFVDLLDVMVITVSSKNNHCVIQIGVQFKTYKNGWNREKRKDVRERVEARFRRVYPSKPVRVIMRIFHHHVSSDLAFAILEQHDNANGWNCFGLKRSEIDKHIRALVVQAEEEICKIGSMSERLVHEEFLKDLDAEYKGINLVEHVRSIRQVPPRKSWADWGLGVDYMSDVFFHTMLEHMTGPFNEMYYPVPEQNLNVSHKYTWILHKLIQDRTYVVAKIIKKYKQEWLTTSQEPKLFIDSDLMGMDYETNLRAKTHRAVPGSEDTPMFGKDGSGTVSPAAVMSPTNWEHSWNGGFQQSHSSPMVLDLENLDLNGSDVSGSDLGILGGDEEQFFIA